MVVAYSGNLGRAHDLSSLAPAAEALADGATRIVRGSVHRASSDAGGLEPVTWRLDFEEASGQHHRLYIATE